MLELAIVGMGGWGRRLVEAVQGKSDKVRFTSAIVARPKRSAAFADKHGLAIGSDYARVLRDPAIQGVVSSGPAHLHAEHALAALNAGKPVLAVKPMAQTAKDAEALQAAARQSGRLLALGFDRCFYPNVAEMRKRLKAGALGRLLHAEGNFCVDRYGHTPAGGWKADPAYVTPGSLADHMLYLLIETLGPIAEVHTQSIHDVSPNKLADVAAVLLRTKGNATGLLTAIGVTADFYRFQVFGTKGWIELRDARHFTFQPVDGEREDVTLPDSNALRAEVEAFADAVQGRSTFPVPVEDAVHGVAVLQAMSRSASEGRPVRV
jgi:predicted dehydrogenase